jgi:hypothetical protein
VGIGGEESIPRGGVDQKGLVESGLDAMEGPRAHVVDQGRSGAPHLLEEGARRGDGGAEGSAAALLGEGGHEEATALE